MRFTILIPCLAAGLSWATFAQSVAVSETSFEAGRFGVVAKSDTDSVLILRRYDGDTLPKTGTTRVGMALGQAGVAQSFTEYLASGQPRGFFEVFRTDLATHEDDTDSDGIKDRTELQAGEFLNPIEGADAVTADVFDLVLDATVSNGVPGAGAGNIEAPHHVDIYRFDGMAGTGVFIDAISYDSALTLQDYVLVDPYGNTLRRSAFGLSDMGPVDLPFDGEYLLLVGDANEDGTGSYSIGLSVIPGPQEFSIAIGDTVADGIPGAGAGNIEAPGAFDIYTFPGTAGETIFVDTLGSTGLTLVDIRLIDPAGNVIGLTAFGLSDIASVELPETGTYRLEVGEATASNTGTYSISLTSVPDPDSFAFSIGDTIADGVPGIGAGNIEAPGAFDIYTFSGTAGEKIFFDTISWTGLTLTDIKLFDPSDGLLVSTSFGLSDVGTVELPVTGTYRLEVGEASSSNTGTYSIAITAIPAPDSFAINIGDTISNGVPGPGAGNIETPGAFDIYTFSGTAGDKIFVDNLGFSGSTAINYRLIDPSSNVIGDKPFNLGDIATVELPETGTYTLEVGESNNDDIGTYSIAITAIPAPDSFAINIGDTISNGVPGAGAGNIETPGAFDIYTFSGAAGDRIFVDNLGFSGPTTINYRLIDPSSNVIGDKPFNLGDIATVELPETGTYTLEVGESNNDDIGTYSIAITAIPAPDSFVISIGDTISNGVPGPGAGNIEVPGAFDIYTFSGTAGEFVEISTGPFAGVNTLNYRLLDPSNSQLDSQQFNLGDMGVIQLPATGIYTIEVGEAPNDETGTYEITVAPHVP